MPAGRRERARPSALGGFLPAVQEWLGQSFAAPSPAQELAWPAIRRGDNVLPLAPTGSGKTLAAFLCAIDDLCRRGIAGELQDGVHVLYITPLKAPGNDIQRNLLLPLEGIGRLLGDDAPRIRAAVRTGDTPQSERAKMVRTPPHILITTPESLFLLLGSQSMAPALQTIRTVIVDEVHAMCAVKRGVHLAVSLERLQDRLSWPLQRVGCSATLRPLDRIAAFQVGSEAGTPRPCTILDAGMRKELDVRVVAPLPDFLEAGNSALWSSAYELLLREVRSHRTTLIFTSSRYKAERTALRLRELSDGGGPRIGAHHGSMSRETRLEAEDALKAGQYDALVATASLELGIDVGAVDLVYQLETPRSVATGLQRVGRAGHLLDATSRGRILCFEREELLEATAIGRAMLEGELDAVGMPRGCLDVLAQQVVGAVAAAPTTADALYSLFTGADPYTDLPRSSFDAVLGMLAGEVPFEMAMPPRPLILWDRATGELAPTRGAAHVAAMNVGTIPESGEYDVVIAGTKKRVGSVQSEFVDDSLRIGDVFVLGSTPWKVAGVQRNRLLVEEAPGATPTVPWWHGPVQSRTTEAGRRVGRLRREIARRATDPDAVAWLQAAYPVSEYGAVALVEYVREQQAAAGVVPDERQLLVETWPDELGRLNVVIHSPYGQRTNRTWGLAIAAAAKRTLRQDWSVTASNDVLLLTRAPLSAAPLHDADGRALLELVSADTVEGLVAEGSRSTVSFAGAFRDAATRSFQVLRAWQGRRVPVWLQSFRAQGLFEAACGHEQYPLMLEVLREHLHEGLDVPAVRELLRAIAQGAVGLSFATVQSPSPFAHSLLIQSRYGDDHQMGRSRRAHLLRLHRRVLQEVLSEEEMSQLLDRRAIERLEAGLQRRSEATRARSAPELSNAIRELGDIPASLEAVQAVAQPDALDLLRPLIEARSVVCMALPECDEAPVRLVAADLWRQYHDAFFGHRRGGRLEVLPPTIVDGQIEELQALPAAEVIPARWRQRTPQPQARLAIVERYLRTGGPTTAYEIMNRTGWPISLVEGLLGQLVEDGKAQRGTYTSDKPAPQWVNRANLEEIHRLTMSYLRRELAACAPYEVVDFTTRWQHLHPSTRLHGLDGLRQVIAQLQGLEIVQGALESEVLPGRVADYRPEMLDRLVASGEVCWRRISPRDLRRGRITLCLRRDMPWLVAAGPLQFDPVAEDDEDIRDVIAQVREHFRAAKVVFFEDLLRDTGLPEGPAMRAVWHLAWTGEISCDTYEAIRHADFQSTLSACYDLGSTPRKIVSGREPAQRVIDRMKRRHLEPRLGRWWATERLVPAKTVPEAEEVLRNWAALPLGHREPRHPGHGGGGPAVGGAGG